MIEKKYYVTVLSLILLAGVVFLLSYINEKPDTVLNATKNNLDSDETKLVNPLSFIDTKCGHEESNVGMTECVIDLLDRTAAEREWKQRKLESATDEQINVGELFYPLKDEQQKITQWREGFENSRDAWCSATVNFFYGSGTPLSTATCKLELETRAVEDLNDLYSSLIDYTKSSGIANFDPTAEELTALVQTNSTTRSCVWADDKECENSP